MINYKAFPIIFLLVAVFLYTPFIGAAQQRKYTLKDFTGDYQSQQTKELYINIVVSGNKLKQIRDWDGREVILDQISELEFGNEQAQLKISFSKEIDGKINKVKIGEDSWIKINGYVPGKTADLDSVSARAVLNQKAEALVAAINSNSRNIVAKFVEGNFSESLRASSERNFIDRAQTTYRLTGGVRYDKSSYFNHHAFFGEYQYKSNDLNNIYQFSLKLDKDHKIKLYNGRVISNTGISKTANQKELVKKLEKTFKVLTNKDIFSGTVLFAKRDSILFTYVSGETNKESSSKNTPDTKFNLGSMNKMFTALSIMQLVERDKIHLNDPISKYLDTTWLPKQIADQLNIHHLLSHSSGMGDFFSKAFQDAPASQFVTLDGYKPFVKTDKLNFKPGTDWSYSNAGMILLGAIVEQVTGLSYFEYVRSNIYEPSGMNVSYSWEHSDGMALGYVPQPDGGYSNNVNSAYTRSSAAGGGYSTVTDLYKFALTLMSDKLVSDSSKSKMFKDYMGRQYGYGFQLWGTPANKIVGHSGGAPGISAVEYIFPDSGYIVVVLSNYDGGSYFTGEYILNEVASLIE